MNTKDKILGSIFGAALGDAMGAITETRSAERIKEDFGGYVDKLMVPPKDCFARNYPLGAVTDDFSLAYFTGKALAKCGGNVTDEVAKSAVLSWAEIPEFFHFAGPTTENAVKALKGTPVDDPKAYIACNNMRGTNGGGMKIFCVGLINPGNLDKAVEDTVTICMPTHPNDAAICAAAAISTAVAEAMTENATLDSVIGAGVYGAVKGKEVAIRRGASRLAVPSTEKRIHLAVEIAKRGLGWENTMLELRDVIGAGLNAFEAIPCVFGILAANRGDAFGAVKMGVNIGDDTDTVATMAGAIAGALYGMSNLPAEYLDTIDQANHMDLRGLADEMMKAYYV